MSVDLTTILEKIIHSTIRKKEIKEITFRIVEKMNKILNNKSNDEFNKENKPCVDKENVHVFYNKNDLSVNELRNEYYKLKGEIGFI